MKKLKIETTDQLREFITWAKDTFTRRIYHHEGGCSTCDYGGYSVTDGYEFDDSMLNENIEAAIDRWIAETFKNNG